MEIKELLRQTNSIIALEQIAQNAEAKVSFWGNRYVSFTDPAYEGTLDIDDLAARVIQLAKDRGFEFTQEERITGRTLAHRITQIYCECDDVTKQRNCFTRSLVFFRGLISNILHGTRGGTELYISGPCTLTRWIWEGKDPYMISPFDRNFTGIFDYYPEIQFRREFHIEPNGEKFEYLDRNYNCPDLYYHAPPQAVADQQ